MQELLDRLYVLLQSVYPHSDVEVIKPRNLMYHDIKQVVDEGKLIDLPVKIMTPNVLGHCHALTAYQFMLDSNIQIYNGFGLVYEEIVADQWYQHSFATKDGYILEPTNWIRDKYFGAPLTTYQTHVFVYNEINNLLEIADEYNLDKDLILRYQKMFQLLKIPKYDEIP